MAQEKMTVKDSEIIEKLREHGDPAYTTAEIAEVVGMTTEGVRNRLESLHESGQLGRKKPSSRTVIWWPIENQDVDSFSS